MQLKTKDSYRIECFDGLNNSSLVSLMSLYQPIIGRDAVVFYGTCLAEGLGQRSLETHGRLSSIMNMDIPTMEKARTKCEQFFLMRTFVKEDEDKNQFIYVLYPPLNVQSFLKNDCYARLLLKTLGQKQYELTITKTMQQPLNKMGFKDITEAFDKKMIESWDAENEVQFSKIQPSYNFSDTDSLNINFDYESLINTTSAIVFPIEARTKDNMRIIGEYATLYGLSANKMRTLIGRCINLSTNTLDVERLKRLCSMQNPDETNASKDPYKLSPVAFLQSRQQGLPVASVDRKILEYLAMDLQMSKEVINVLVEYVLNINQNRLTKKFVESIASTWVREKVITKEQAITMTKKIVQSSYNTKQKKKDILPAYYEEIKKNGKKDIELISREEEEEIERKLKGLGE